MTQDDRRPNPDELLERVQIAEQQARRGKLKIFFGASPGVGKTYACCWRRGACGRRDWMW